MKELKPFNSMLEFRKIKVFVDKFKDQNRGLAAYSSGITLEEAEQLGWLKNK